MEFTSLVDTSLGLNAKPIRVVSGKPKQEVESNFIGLRMNIGNKDEAGELMEELNRVSAENRKLSEMLTVVCGNYNALREQVREYMNKQQQQSGSINDHNSSQVIMGSRKRKSPSNNNNANSESSSSDEDSAKKPRRELEHQHHIKANTSKIYVKTEASDTSLIVKDGYQWRKYGQKVTRDNPCPRAYFRIEPHFFSGDRDSAGIAWNFFSTPPAGFSAFNFSTGFRNSTDLALLPAGPSTGRSSGSAWFIDFTRDIG
nr:probable WRKY transcription factor 40 [Ipomoea batatas]